MKQLFITIILFISPFILFQGKQGMFSEQKTVQQYEIIPDEAIRLRILANSDAEKDQRVKHLVRDRISEQIENWVKHMTDIEGARETIRKNIPKLEDVAIQTLEEIDANQEITIEYRSKVPFPMKLYDSVLYPAGDYEAVLVTLGEGKGANWWCVLFPPLCFLDFNHGTTVADKELDEDEEEEPKLSIRFFLFEWLGLS